jgi:hypothetical protein
MKIIPQRCAKILYPEILKLAITYISKKPELPVFSIMAIGRPTLLMNGKL